MKRLFDDAQNWTLDGQEALRIAGTHMRAAVAELVAAGFSCRDAGLVLHEEVTMSVALHHIAPPLRANVEAFRAEGPQ
ncbi:hypothetical protein KABACHOK_00440 [Brevundimonas phage vB_BpoS-Kabachok]|uniref:Uncharacterized protein n=2 Tax=Marchewkavirus TaxID=3425052 RepID=A0A9E7MQI7_9CAUD|nr:hypothetical protein KABACHOK_00440 [Brevundimonas phage vB_BpoS-Kabachok]USN14576.1 hypothetical protein DOMOVOI_01010 [Brevundimonas phage vB_BpoS-Domovoi]